MSPILHRPVERVGVAVADEDRRTPGVAGPVHDLAGLAERDVGAERLEVAVDEPEPAGRARHVDPLVAAGEVELLAGERQRQQVPRPEVALSGAEHLHRRADPLEDHVTHRQPDVARVADARRVEERPLERRRLHVGQPVDADRSVGTP